MDDVLDELARIIQRCKRTASSFEDADLVAKISKLKVEIEKAEKAWSGGWLGYHSRTYLRDLQPKTPGEHFDTEWGAQGAFSNRTRGDWVEYDPEAVRSEIFRRATCSAGFLDVTAGKAEEVFDDAKLELIATLEAALSERDDKVLQESLAQIKKLESHYSFNTVLDALSPKQFMSRDSRAVQEGRHVAPHLTIQIELFMSTSRGTMLLELADKAKAVLLYLEKARKMKGKTVAKRGGAVFIGHGGASTVWKDLQMFLRDRLGVQCEEFNTTPVAGRSNKERLLEVLDKCTFAFLVMTAEDETKDGKLRARQNVVHEAGLFQGRYGWERGILLLEEGCADFSNHHGVGEIRFPKGNIMANSEEIRRVLEREGVI